MTRPVHNVNSVISSDSDGIQALRECRKLVELIIGQTRDIARGAHLIPNYGGEILPENYSFKYTLDASLRIL
jgi:hypothetical protein